MSDSGNPSDSELLLRLRAGDEEAFATLYRRRGGSVFRFLLRMTGRKTVAEDVTQEVFMVLVREAQGYDPERGSLLPYLLGIARKKVLRIYSRETLVTTGDGILPEAVAPDDPFTLLSQSEVVTRVRRAVLELSPRFREAVSLCDLEGLGYAEAAKVLDCPIGTVRSRLHRGRGELMRKLQDGEGQLRTSYETRVKP